MHLKRKFLLFTLICCLAFCAVFLTACDSTEKSGELYMTTQSFSYDSESDTVTALVSVSSKEKSDIVGKSVIKTEKKGFFIYYSYNYEFDADIWNKVKAAAVVNEDLENALNELGVDREYNVKLQYVYATDYKSVSADGKMSQKGKVKTFVWDYSDGEKIQMKLNQRVENRMAWYGLIIGLTLTITAAITIPIEVLKFKNYIKREKERNASNENNQQNGN